MNIKDLSKKKLLEYLSHNHNSNEWRILIIDDKCYSLLTTLMDLNDFLRYEILVIQKMNLKREKVNYPAIYICEINDITKKIIKNDIKSELYTNYRILSINGSGEFIINIRNGIKVSRMTINYEGIDLCYKLINEVVICDLNRIPSFCNVINLNPHVHLTLADYKQNLTNNTNNRDDINTNQARENTNRENINNNQGRENTNRENINTNQGRENIKNRENREFYNKINELFSDKPRIGDLLIFDRRLDVITPVCHFYTFQTILRDYKLINDNEVEGRIWEKVKYLHLAEVNDILSEKAKKLLKGIKKIDEAESKDLTRLVLEAPENIKTKENLNQLLDLTDQALSIFEEKGTIIGNYEMDLINGYTIKNKKVTINKFLEILDDPEISKNDKLRLLLIIQSTRGIEDIKLELERNSIFKDLEWIKNMPRQKTHKAKKYKYEISRYTPRLKKILQDFYNKKEYIYSYSISEPLSLRKKGFHFRNETKKVLIIYFINGVTYEELRIINEISNNEGANIIVASDQLMIPDDFIERIKKGEI